jgi:ABC-type antimicrobial peptide transport system permease subunit
MALGAERRDVLRMVLWQGMALAAIGIVAGLASAFVLARYLESLSALLFGVKATDPLTYAVMVAMMVVVGLVACLLPARRATKVDPLVALRYE